MATSAYQVYGHPSAPPPSSGPGPTLPVTGFEVVGLFLAGVVALVVAWSLLATSRPKP